MSYAKLTELQRSLVDNKIQREINIAYWDALKHPSKETPIAAAYKKWLDTNNYGNERDPLAQKYSKELEAFIEERREKYSDPKTVTAMEAELAAEIAEDKVKRPGMPPHTGITQVTEGLNTKDIQELVGVNGNEVGPGSTVARMVKAASVLAGRE